MKLQLRYGGCGGCLSNCKYLLKHAGLMPDRHYIVTMHDDHKEDPIYKERPEFLKKHTGAILINPETQSFINLYPNDEVLQYTPALDAAIQKLLK
jgi:hypothetical protein